MMTFVRTALFGLLLVATPALADDAPLDGAPCATSDDCGSLRCIAERCRDVDVIKHGERPMWATSAGHRAMFGNGTTYAPVVVIADLLAAASEPFLVLGATSNSGGSSTTFGVLGFLPVAFAGSITHAAHGRWVPAIISFFAWTSLAGTTFVVGGLFGVAFENNGFQSSMAASWAAGLAFGATGAAGLTILDAWLARTAGPDRIEDKPMTVHLVPSIVPMRGGALATLGATF
jgi:hypothetical protein